MLDEKNCDLELGGWINLVTKEAYYGYRPGLQNAGF